MNRWKIMIVALLAAVTAMVGPVALVAPDASADTCLPGECMDLMATFSTPDCRICQAAMPCEFYLVLSRVRAVSVTGTVETQNGTALSGVDFEGIRDLQVTIPAGATRASFTVRVFGRPPGTPSRVFYVMLTRVSSGTIGNRRVEAHIPGPGPGVQVGHGASHP